MKIEITSDVDTHINEKVRERLHAVVREKVAPAILRDMKDLDLDLDPDDIKKVTAGAEQGKILAAAAGVDLPMWFTAKVQMVRVYMSVLVTVFETETDEQMHEIAQRAFAYIRERITTAVVSLDTKVLVQDGLSQAMAFLQTALRCKCCLKETEEFAMRSLDDILASGKDQFDVRVSPDGDSGTIGVSEMVRHLNKVLH